MTLTPVEFGAFGGLNLQTDPQNVGGGSAIDAHNIELDGLGRVRARDGTTAITPALGQALGDIIEMPQVGDFTRFLVVAADGKVRAYSSGGTLVATSAALLTANLTMRGTVIGTSTATAAYFVEASGGAIRKFDGTTFSSPAGMPSCRTVAVSPWDNRLVAGAVTTSASLSRVQFSDPGAPETWGVNNWVELTPGDGESITGMTAWRNMLYVFKANKFFVFYGTSIDGSGNPIFNYRTVDVGVGHGARSSNFLTGGTLAVGPDGVYFSNPLGIWRTTGDQPVRVSQQLDPLFRGGLSAYTTLTGPSEMKSTAKLAFCDDRLYASYWSGASSVVLVRDPDIGWMVWDGLGIINGLVGVKPASALKSQLLISSDQSTSVYSYQRNSGATTDGGTTGTNGTAVSASYRCGFWNPGQPGAESVVREWLIDGSGTITWKTAVNDTATLGSGASVTLGTSPAVAQGRDRRAVRGRNVSFEISGSAPWSVSRVVANLRGQRSAGLKAT